MAARRRRRGISLVEVMVTIAIILTLMSVLGVGVFRTWQWSKVETTKLTMGRIGQEIEIYRIRNHRPPTMAQGLGVVSTNEKLPTDGWDGPIEYRTPGPDGAEYALVSLAGDGAEGGTDWNEDILWTPNQR